jgi:hypothetical protein
MNRHFAWIAALCIASSAMAYDPFATSFAPCEAKADDIDRYVKAAQLKVAADNVPDAIGCSRRFLNWALDVARDHSSLVEALKRRHEAYSSFVEALVPEFSQVDTYRTRVAELRARLLEANERVITEGREAKLIQ